MNKELLKTKIIPAIKSQNITTIGFMGNKGSGKTYGSAILMNEIAKELKNQTIVFDLTGAYTKDKLLDNALYVDVEDDIFKRKNIQEPIVKMLEWFYKQRKTKNFLVLNMMKLRKKDLVEFSEVFHETLRDIGGFGVCIDEAGEIYPQGAGPYSHTGETAVRLGRNWGIYPYIIITQRPQKVNKEIFAHCEMFVALRTIYPLEQNIIKDLFGIEAIETPTFKRRMSSLKKGEAMLFFPEEAITSKIKINDQTNEFEEEIIRRSKEEREIEEEAKEIEKEDQKNKTTSKAHSKKIQELLNEVIENGE